MRVNKIAYFGQIPDSALHQLDLPALKVLTVIYHHTDGAGENAHPGNEWLMKRTGLSNRGVSRGLKKLREIGLVEQVRRGNRGGMVSVYRLSLPSSAQFLPAPPAPKPMEVLDLGVLLKRIE